MKEKLFLLLLLLNLISASRSASAPEVELQHKGKISGLTLQSLDGRDFFAFRGIPYAKPPLGDLRFQAPLPAAPWKGVRDGTKEGPPCAQVPLMGDNTFVGSEDCLYLNVYTPNLPSEKDDELMPVLFWIHGGAFYAGDGGIEENGPEFLMDQNVVIVTINYRLGPFGFLSSGDQKIPGNFGLKDQVMALKWVQENIEKFGGNKEKVVLWGYSAGASLVEAHLFSPMSTGLFSAAIYQSGHLQSECGLRTRPAAVLQVLGSITNCDQFEILDQLKCLRKLPASKLAQAVNSFPSWGMKIPIAFNVVQEFPNFKDNSWREEPFLTEDPNKMLEEGRVLNDVPTITGVAKDEGNPIAYTLMENPDLYRQATKNFREVARLGSCLYGLEPKKKFDKIKQFYFGEKKPINEDQLLNYIDFQGDSFVNWGVVDTAQKLARASKSPVYFYVFTFEGRISEAMAFGLTPMPGVGHADDLAYIFRRKVPFPGDGKPNELERQTIKRMGSIFENFARTGEPVPEINEHFDILWEPLSKDGDFQYLKINTELQMESGFPFPERMKFWQQLTKKKKPKSKPDKTEL